MRGRRVVISLVSVHQFVSLPPRRSVQIYFYPQSYPSPTPLFPLLFHVHDSIRRFEGRLIYDFRIFDTVFGFSLVGGFLKFSQGNHPAFFRSLNVIRFEDNQITSRVSLSLSFLFHRFLKNLASLEQGFVRRWKLIESIPSDDRPLRFDNIGARENGLRYRGFLSRFGETISHQDPVLRSTCLLSKDRVTYTEKRTQRGRMWSGMHFRRHRFRQQTVPAVPQRNRTRDQISSVFLPFPPRIHRRRSTCTDIERSRTFFAETEVD